VALVCFWSGCGDDFALLYLRYSVPVYTASATMLVKDEKKGGLQSELAGLFDLGIMTGVKNNVDNEVEVIKSRTIVRKAKEARIYNDLYFGRKGQPSRIHEKPIVFSFYNINDSFYKSQRHSH
jgi:uncharacterized protein involved in exopolysaccharide biosynthesis